MENENVSVNDMATTAGVVADIISRHVAPQLVHVPGPDPSSTVPLLVLPTGLKAHEVKEYADTYRTAPERREGTARLVEIDSFIDHVNRFRDEDSALFAVPSPTAPKLMAVFDYHRRCQIPVGPELSDSSTAIELRDRINLRKIPTTYVDGAPRFGRHRALYEFPLSDEWKGWAEKNGKWMSQGEFGTWLEDRIIDVADPERAFTSAKEFQEALGIAMFASPARLRTLSLGLSVHETSRVTNKIDPSTGEATMSFESTHEDIAGGSLSVPRAFLIQISVFRGGARYQLPVRLKYRVAGGKVTWSYEVHDPTRAFDHAFREACERSQEDTGLPLFYGSPEGT